jgi:DNA (cytosine-5)-methyltransferase 1
MHKFPYRWALKDANFTKDKGKVFSCFACGGGSTMGYKLAGFDVIGCNEIDPRMNKVYVANHHPRLNYLCDIREMVTKELPDALYHLDVLDGSPPCSSFSVAGNRDEDWGKEKKFREGQAMQVLDTLFFDFIDLAKELQPKIVIAENVKGLLLGKAFNYVRRIYEEFDKAGYVVCHTLCDATYMGVPQMRERVFFTAIRKDLFQYIPQRADLFDSYPVIDLTFNEEPILWGEVYEPGNMQYPLTDFMKSMWELRQNGDIDLSICCGRAGRNPNSNFQSKFLYKDKMPNTVIAGERCILFDEPRNRSDSEILSCSSWPRDYDFKDEKVRYICGMSVPPVMMAQVASRVYEQWLSKINK